MRTPRAFAGLFLVMLASCGGSAASRFRDPVAALEEGDQARVAKNEEKAAAAYEHAIAHAGSMVEVKHKALLGLGELQAAKAARTQKQADFEAAIATFERVERECAAQHDVYGAQRIIDAWIKARSVQLAGKALAAAEARFPADASKLETHKTAVKMLESGDTEGLKKLGYVGD